MQPIQCSCEKCAAMCEHSTCMPTPAEARALIRAGFGRRLTTYRFYPDPTRLAMVAPAPKGQEGAHDLPHSRACCTFFTAGKCELHNLGLKPLEGRLTHHDRDWLPIRMEVAGHWRGRQFDSVLATLNSTTLQEA